MPNRLHRYYSAGYLHFITTSCYRWRPPLGTAHNRDLFLQVLEQVRQRYRFVVAGYVVMPEHVHLLLGEPERGNPSVVMLALKQSFARRLLRRLRSRDDARQTTLWSTAAEEGRIWQHRFYDFVVFTEKKKSKNYATCTATRCGVDWFWNRSNGHGAASSTTPKETRDWCG